MFTPSLSPPEAKAKGIPVRKEQSLSLKSYARHYSSWVNGIAIVYLLGAYTFSIFGISSDIWWLNLIGVIALVHSLMWAAYFAHELFHDNIFSQQELNDWLGEAVLFMTGSCYSRYKDLKHHHIVHHTKRVDLSPFAPFSLTDFLLSLPVPIRKIIVALELIYFPAINLTLRWMIALAPFLSQNRKNERLRNGIILLVRGSLFTGLALYSPKAAIVYFIGYILFLNITQFLECFQHTFPAYGIDRKIPWYSQEHEEENTYTIYISRQWRWLDLLVFLNHNYHNAHHRLMTCPWYLLEKLDDQLYPTEYEQRISVFKLLGNYFKQSYRIRRLFWGQGNVKRTDSGLELENFVGATGISFLMLRKSFDWVEITSNAYSKETYVEG
ncbi:fatty acid desaturase [Synechococcus sp. PCC 7336]|uniref:fatty acid desaturase family protein n=1 Tax=Synechococcus sp. PCC 7336 TaxID=195250 RepID=UPI000344C619|nr:fatty acid desaturase [Synechococcus sp. PCC 7336]